MEPNPPIISRIAKGALNNSCSLTVEWNPASEGNQCPIKAYKVYYREVLPDGTNQTWRGELVNQPTLSYRLNLKNLKCETEYEIAVTAYNTKGESAKSKSMKERTTGKSYLYRRAHTHTYTHTHTQPARSNYAAVSSLYPFTPKSDQLQFSLPVPHQRYITQYGEFGNR